MINFFINFNIRISRTLDQLFPVTYKLDGNKFFSEQVLKSIVPKNAIVYEIGGGSQPHLSLEAKQALGSRIVGIDIEKEELLSALDGIYDEIIEADICQYQGKQDADVVICRATLEHVCDMPGAIKAIASTLKLGGRAYIFAPCKNALFARLNLLLPQKLKVAILYKLFPHKALGHDGFPAFYHKCTPSEIAQLCVKHQLAIVDTKHFWVSSYFYVFVPAYLIWRIYQSILKLVLRDDACETFYCVLEKSGEI